MAHQEQSADMEAYRKKVTEMPETAGVVEENVKAGLNRCPNCGWLVSDVEYLSTMFDFDCPRCGLKKLSQFSGV